MKSIAMTMLMLVGMTWVLAAGASAADVATQPATKPAICEAAEKGDLATVKALLKDNPDLVLDKDSHGLTPLHGAAGFGHKAVAELLIPNKADVSAKNKDGDTPLRAAVQNGHKDVADLLRQHGGTE